MKTKLSIFIVLISFAVRADTVPVNQTVSWMVRTGQPDSTDHSLLLLESPGGNIESISVQPYSHTYIDGQLVAQQFDFFLLIGPLQDDGSVFEPAQRDGLVQTLSADFTQTAGCAIYRDFEGGEFATTDYINTHPGHDVLIDRGYTVLSYDYTPVPEPSVMALCAFGLIGLWLTRRRPAVRDGHHL